MVMKQTSFNPSPHRHLLTDVIGANQALYGDEGRTEPPICEMQFTGGSTFTVGNNSDTPATAGWSAVQDNATMFFDHTAGGIGSGYARIRIPQTGRYYVEWRYYMDGLGTSAPTANVLKDSASVTTGSIMNAQGAANGWACPTAIGEHYLTAGTFLYFWVWQGSGGTRTGYSTWFGGSKTRAIVRWVSKV